ncbi:dethiobiotin synthase [Capillimicrobium parvum]|uniref:ATP-dependent dethiobiotin synthetase BioD n=1 Tax=Capillimicrobium parvum TaxID=2884022 RepID=A0A9E6Y2X1_9ACTN|nr:dethiobiotin synthase [Capillimicrobium parvum]UGS39050.1 ATP-dependent dethiobiotin synthetase BioD [Capillimicrobium parvum]
MRVVAIAGTDTGVGKTIVTAALAARARARGERVAVVKPAQTGVGAGEPGDVDDVRRLSGVDDVHELVRLGEPLAPATAAAREGRAGVSAEAIAAAVRELDGRDLVLVEGAGGLLVRLGEDGSTLADVAGRLDAAVVVVARAGLGTLNHAALTCEALAARGLRCPGVVIGAWPAAPDLAACCNLRDLPAYTGRPVLGRVPEGAGRLEPGAFFDGAREWITTEEPI